MSTFNWSKYVLGTLAAAGILAGCSSGSASLPSAGMAPIQSAGMHKTAQSKAQRPQGNLITLLAMTAYQGFSPAVHPDQRKSWMKPAKKTSPLVYVSDVATNDVYVYNYDANKVGSLVGTLTGFSEPQGLCTDGKHVWVTNTLNESISEYARGGSAPIKVLFDSGFYPVGCSWDKTTGNLAVTNIYQDTGSSGNIAIYAHASGSPVYHYASNVFNYFLCSFDNNGNLFVDGLATNAGPVALAELAANASKAKPMTENATISFPGGVQWDGKYLEVTDQGASMGIEFKVTGTALTEVSQTPFNGASDIVQTWIDARTTTIFGPDANLAQLGLYKYRVGGNPFQVVTGFSEPIGVTVTRL
jgi:hypothetical protein